MGREAAKQLAAKGANVAVIARTQSKLDACVEEMKAVAKVPSKQRFFAVSADVRTYPECRRALEAAVAWYGGVVDILWLAQGKSRVLLVAFSELIPL